MEPGKLYNTIEPVLPLGLPFVQTAVSEGWFDWPALPELFPKSFPGVKTSRDGFLVDVDLDRLKARVGDYFDAGLSHEEIARRYPGVVKTTAGFNARAVRDSLLARSGPDEAGFIHYAYRPFDTRWLYWEADGEVCLIVRVPTIIRMCSMETYGSKHANEKPRKTSHAEPYFVISPT